jgi:hypothetical protein
MTETHLMSGFGKTRSESAVHVNGRTNHCLGKIIYSAILHALCGYFIHSEEL